MFRSFAHSVLAIASFLAFSVYSVQSPQTPSSPANSAQSQKHDEDVVVLSGVATTARIADPNEKVVFSGQVMRMADFVAAVSSSNAAAQRLRTPETRSHEKERPTPPSKPSN
jgi:hypothetical protein